jgi:hypothetical protein
VATTAAEQVMRHLFRGRQDLGHQPASPTSGSATRAASIPAFTARSPPRTAPRSMPSIAQPSPPAARTRACRDHARYHENYYGAFVFNPDGHNIEAVCHAPLEGRCSPLPPRGGIVVSPKVGHFERARHRSTCQRW